MILSYVCFSFCKSRWYWEHMFVLLFSIFWKLYIFFHHVYRINDIHPWCLISDWGQKNWVRKNIDPYLVFSERYLYFKTWNNRVQEKNTKGNWGKNGRILFSSFLFTSYIRKIVTWCCVLYTDRWKLRKSIFY